MSNCAACGAQIFLEVCTKCGRSYEAANVFQITPIAAAAGAVKLAYSVRAGVAPAERDSSDMVRLETAAAAQGIVADELRRQAGALGAYVVNQVLSAGLVSMMLPRSYRVVTDCRPGLTHWFDGTGVLRELTPSPELMRPRLMKGDALIYIEAGEEPPRAGATLNVLGEFARDVSAGWLDEVAKFIEVATQRDADYAQTLASALERRYALEPLLPTLGGPRSPSSPEREGASDGEGQCGTNPPRSLPLPSPPETGAGGDSERPGVVKSYDLGDWE